MTLFQKTHVLLDLDLPCLLVQIHVLRDTTHPFDRPRGHATLLQEAQRLAIDPVHWLAQVPQHRQHRQPVLLRRGEIGRVQRIAHHMAMLILPLHAGAGGIQMLPRATVQSGIIDGRLFRVEALLFPHQQVGNLPRRNAHSQVAEPLRQFRLRQVASIGEGDCQGFDARPEAAFPPWRHRR